MPRPQIHEYAPFYANYVQLASGNNAMETLLNATQHLYKVFNNIPENKADYAYQPGKWTIKQLLQHIIDTERIFAYRALRIARNDTTPLAGFDENDYANAAHAQHRSLESLQLELQLLRQVNIMMFDQLTEADWQKTGTASNCSISVNAIAFIMVGHIVHHANILQERYL